MKEDNYIVIHGWMIKNLSLKDTELIIFAIIHGFTQDGINEYTGGINYLIEATNKSKSSVIRSLKNLVENGFLTRQDVFSNGVKFVKYRAVLSKCNHRYQNDTTGVNMNKAGVNMTFDRCQNDFSAGIKMTPNNTISNNKENNKENNIYNENQNSNSSPSPKAIGTSLNEIQNRVGNESYHPSEDLQKQAKEVQNKFHKTNFSKKTERDQVAKELINEVKDFFVTGDDLDKFPKREQCLQVWVNSFLVARLDEINKPHFEIIKAARKYIASCIGNEEQKDNSNWNSKEAKKEMGETWPNYFDVRLWKSLSAPQSQVYWKHLKTLGYRMNKAQGGTVYIDPKGKIIDLW